MPKLSAAVSLRSRATRCDCTVGGIQPDAPQLVASGLKSLPQHGSALAASLAVTAALRDAEAFCSSVATYSRNALRPHCGRDAARRPSVGRVGTEVSPTIGQRTCCFGRSDGLPGAMPKLSAAVSPRTRATRCDRTVGGIQPNAPQLVASGLKSLPQHGSAPAASVAVMGCLEDAEVSCGSVATLSRNAFRLHCGRGFSPDALLVEASGLSPSHKVMRPRGVC
ncbi:hypothetical protein QE400_003445 [Xanthomonas sacchari]|nr:hypothetical protein [Xanthomonas sacchari]